VVPRVVGHARHVPRVGDSRPASRVASIAGARPRRVKPARSAASSGLRSSAGSRANQLSAMRSPNGSRSALQRSESLLVASRPLRSRTMATRVTSTASIVRATLCAPSV
jgi:hypothetical protein